MITSIAVSAERRARQSDEPNSCEAAPYTHWKIRLGVTARENTDSSGKQEPSPSISISALCDTDSSSSSPSYA